MVSFQTKNPNSGKFWRARDWKMSWPVGIFFDQLGKFMTFWYILCSFGTFCFIWYILRSFGTFCVHLVHFVFIWYILCSFGTFCVHLVYFVFIWYILRSFGTFCVHLVHFVFIWYLFPVLVSSTKKNLANMVCMYCQVKISNDDFQLVRFFCKTFFDLKIFRVNLLNTFLKKMQRHLVTGKK
jgi:hypothetical protein